MTPAFRRRGAQPERSSYGPDRSQFGELYRPEHAEHDGTVVVVHGGFWRAQYGLALGRKLARDLVGRGYTVWNLEYRRVGDGGGWPATFDDIALGIDHLANLDVDTSRVVAVGHSAGGHLAVWAAGRPQLPAGGPGASPAVRLTAAVSQAGVLDLAVAQDTGVGAGAAADLLGGGPAALPDRYLLADPIQRLPLGVPVLCVHAPGDANVPLAQSTAYVRAATAAGDDAALIEVAGDHFTLIDSASPDWAVVRDALPALLAGRLP
ncbi:alpha/beta hydrolase family protein [uncultured Jatrophihabitans sp.]|uniref:alpha/beta hydrolase family protein n=1 Tax=uncultured Jatrophihabitans sp. TaxID=1610747 RepID=UPI0035CB4C2D